MRLIDFYTESAKHSPATSSIDVKQRLQKLVHDKPTAVKRLLKLKGLEQNYLELATDDDLVDALYLNYFQNQTTSEGLRDPKDNPCWSGYHPVGTKKKNGRTVPNCVPESKEDLEESLSWTALDSGLSLIDKIEIFEEFYTNGNLTESINEDKKSYFTSLFDMSDSPEKNQTYIVVPLALIGNKIKTLDQPSYLKFLGKSKGQLVFTSSTGQKRYPSVTMRDLSVFNTFTFLSSDAYDKFKTALTLKFDINLPDVNLLKNNTSVEEDSDIDDFIARGGEIQQLPYRNSRKEKRAAHSLSSRHIGGLGREQGRGKLSGLRGRAANLNISGTARAVVGERTDGVTVEMKNGSKFNIRSIANNPIKQILGYFIRKREFEILKNIAKIDGRDVTSIVDQILKGGAIVNVPKQEGITEQERENKFRDKQIKSMVRAARAAHPDASEDEAIALYLDDKERYDFTFLNKEEEDLETRVQHLQTRSIETKNEIDKLKNIISNLDRPNSP